MLCRVGKKKESNAVFWIALTRGENLNVEPVLFANLDTTLPGRNI